MPQDASRTPSNILVVSDSLHLLPDAVAVLAGSGHRIGYVHDLTPLEEIAEDAAEISVAEADAIVMGRVMGVGPAALDLAARCRVVALHTSGSDNIDLAAATERGVLVTTVKGINAAQCADFAVGLMLATVRQIVRGDRAIRAGRWASDTAESADVSGATLGIVGLGLIGREVAKRSAAFDMEILAHTRTPDHAFAERYGIRFTTLDDLLDRSDIVSINASLTSETRGMIGERELRRMKRGAYLINIARGELLDEAALYRALSEGWIAGAGLDVFASEPLRHSPLFALDNVVVTPHQAGLTTSGMIGAAVRAARNALGVLAGEIPRDTINPEAFARRSAQ